VLFFYRVRGWVIQGVRPFCCESWCLLLNLAKIDFTPSYAITIGAVETLRQDTTEIFQAPQINGFCR